MDARSSESTFSGPVPYGRVMKFEVAGDAIKETAYTFSTDKPTVIVEYTARFNGNDYPIELHPEDGVAQTRGRPTGRADRQDSRANRQDGNQNGLGQGHGVDGHHRRHQDGTESSASGLREPTTLHAILARLSTTPRPRSAAGHYRRWSRSFRTTFQ